MTNEVVHDNLHAEYLAEISKLDATRELPENTYPISVIAVWVAILACLSRWATPMWWLLAGAIVVVLLGGVFAGASHAGRLTRKYREAGNKYLLALAPSVLIGNYDITMTERTRAKVSSIRELLYVDLRDLARSKGKYGWSATETAIGTLPEVQKFIEAAHVAKRLS